MRLKVVLLFGFCWTFFASPAASEGLVGKTIQGSYDWHICYDVPAGLHCMANNSARFKIYVGLKGHAFDYFTDRSGEGEESTIGVPHKGSTMSIHGNVLMVTNRGRGGSSVQAFTVQGNQCSIAVSGTFKMVHYVVSNQQCSVIDGHAD